MIFPVASGAPVLGFKRSIEVLSSNPVNFPVMLYPFSAVTFTATLLAVLVPVCANKADGTNASKNKTFFIFVN